MKRLLAGMIFVAAMVMAAAPAWAQKTVTFAYQDMMNHGAGCSRARKSKGDRLQDQLAPVRRRRRRDPGDDSGDVQLGGG
jgi:hypothetical protein